MTISFRTTPRTLDEVDLTSPSSYASDGYPYPHWPFLREHAPVYWYVRPGVQPFWSITRYEDIQRISRDPLTFSSVGELFVVHTDEESGDRNSVSTDRSNDQPTAGEMPLLINMDPPEYGRYREIVNRRFSRRGMRLLEKEIDRIAADVVDRVAADIVEEIAPRGRIDFVNEVAARLPLAAVGELLGVPRDRWNDMFRWTSEDMGAADPEYQDGRSTQETGNQALVQLLDYFGILAEQKRRQPGDDLMTTIVQARIDGEPLSAEHVAGYGFLLIIAGNETTRNATSGGMLALIEHPEQLERLRRFPEMLDGAIEEILRWTSPLIHMARRATADTEIRGQPIANGDTLVMWYPSANHDESVFDQPGTFDITRSPNDHLAFGGFGEHFCLGANLARLELRSIFHHLFTRLDDFQPDGEVERLASGAIGGIKHLPISFTRTERVLPNHVP